MSRNAVVTLLFCTGLFLQICFGILNYGSNGPSGFDFAYLYTAGRTWWAHQNPYNIQSFAAYNVTAFDLPSGFAYPPNISTFALVVSLIPFNAAAILFSVLNFSLLIVLARSTQILSLPFPGHFSSESSSKISESKALPLAIAMVFSPFAANVMHMGQTSILVTATLIWGWLFFHRGKYLLSGALFAIAIIKPQISLLPLIWLCTKKQWHFYLSFCIASIAFSFGALFAGSPYDTLVTWMASTDHYRKIEFNALGNEHVTSVQSLLAAFGLPFGVGAAALAAVLGGICWTIRDRLRPTDQLSILLLISFCLIPAHDYDYVALGPALASIWSYCRTRLQSAVAAGLLALMYLPQRVLRVTELTLAIHWRDIVILACLIYLFWLLSRTPRESEWSVPG